MKDPQLVFNRQWWTMIRLLDRDDRIQLLDNLMQSYFDQKEPELMSDAAAAVWSHIQKAMKERNRQRIKVQRYRNNGTVTGEEEPRNKEETPSPLNPLSKEEKKKKEEGRSAHEKSFDEAFARKYPRLSRMQCPLTFDEYCKLLRKYPYPLIQTIIQQMEAYKKIHIYASTYRTCVNWLCREIKRIKEDGRWEPYERALQKQISKLS